jgi:hypothetical protein
LSESDTRGALAWRGNSEAPLCGRDVARIDQGVSAEDPHQAVLVVVATVEGFSLHNVRAEGLAAPAAGERGRSNVASDVWN